MELSSPSAPSEQGTVTPTIALPLRQSNRSPDAVPSPTPSPPLSSTEPLQVIISQSDEAPQAGTSQSNPRDSSRQETWVDFLRNPPPDADPYPHANTNWITTRPQPPTTEGTTPELYSRDGQHDQAMADRKRRLTQPESPARRTGPRPSLQTASGPSHQTDLSGAVPTSAGASTNTAIDLTASPSVSPRPSPSHHSRPPIPPIQDTSRRQSDVVLPRWQPDSEVNQCPVCNTQFTFFYRKHHCRKCGRVVCAQCSPHRITIPRQFIVHPPALPSAIIDLTGDLEEESSPVSPRQMWGGEEVRVCNPCVPDPNLSPPPQLHYPSDVPAPPAWNLPHPNINSGSRLPPRRHRNSAGPLPNMPVHPVHRSTLSDAVLLSSAQDAFRYRPLNFTNPSSVRDLWPPTAPPPPPSISASNLYPLRVSSANGAAGPSPPPYRYRSLLDTTTPLASATPHSYSNHLPPVNILPRRQMAEEDMCPIGCGAELPPIGPNGDSSEREAHVRDCIDSHTYNASSPTPLPPTPQTQPASQTHNVIGHGPSASTSVPSAGSSSLPSATSGGLSSYGTPPLRRMTGGRGINYTATEKDCIDGEGEPAECVICLIDFVEGDVMKRLECLCRFHKVCLTYF
jgi:hypothetical protein